MSRIENSSNNNATFTPIELREEKVAIAHITDFSDRIIANRADLNGDRFVTQNELDNYYKSIGSHLSPESLNRAFNTLKFQSERHKNHTAAEVLADALASAALGVLDQVTRQMFPFARAKNRRLPTIAITIIREITKMQLRGITPLLTSAILRSTVRNQMEARYETLPIVPEYNGFKIGSIFNNALLCIHLINSRSIESFLISKIGWKRSFNPVFPLCMGISHMIFGYVAREAVLALIDLSVSN